MNAQDYYVKDIYIPFNSKEDILYIFLYKYHENLLIMEISFPKLHTISDTCLRL